MGFVGNTSVEAVLQPGLTATDTVGFTLDEEVDVSYLSAYLDGGGGPVQQVVTARLQRLDGALMGEVDSLVLPGDPPGWRTFAFDDPVRIQAGAYQLLLELGAGNAARIALPPDPAPPAERDYGFDDWGDWAYGSGGHALTGAGTPSLWMHFRATTDLPDADEEWYAALGWWSSQEVFGATAVVPGSARLVSCGWYGEKFNPNVGAFAVVNAEGPLADLVGERLRVSSGAKSVYVYVVDEADILEDVALYRRAFAGLSLLDAAELDVTVETMA